jgi:hypothetical protein
MILFGLLILAVTATATALVAGWLWLTGTDE